MVRWTIKELPIGWLVITRRVGERIRIGDTVVEVQEIHEAKVRLAIEADPQVKVRREPGTEEKACDKATKGLR